MANEVSIVELFGEGANGRQIQYTCASNVAIPKGTILKLSGARTVATLQATDINVPPAGIAAMDKSITDDDASTTISVYSDGIFSCKAGGDVIKAGQLVVLSGTNIVSGFFSEGVRTLSGGFIFGKALQNIAANGTGEIRVNL